mmetsp:Transcript_25477/g.35754  ORF Transcript_25477/g.35754 Transcript_25477/m.35754 type:complete len:540 (+) Transcript_25477:118-1737(+)|eukprot:CAMPEP_0168545536 /NCGR_PEP_ID=MMETSP0413-20121227/3013_1 /TAXON_ID=136452 /ORGANISM="Filamoeba nolandi, Strain NC-AS-23-1" /LENGTH=539 /DNA_ID=CAMNT_0008575645 /DNA_START=50 /DNA_END=1669 /DNA_ORIENTATION=-
MDHASFSKPNYTSATTDRKVCYYYEANIGNYYYGQGHPMKPHRIRMAHNLLLNYGIYKKMEIYRPKYATESEITKFHSDDYIDFLRLVTPDNMADYARQLVKFNVGEDCPVFDGMFQFCQLSAGGSIGGAVKLNHGDADVAVNWTGGLHHAKKSEASGFCYVNDIVLAILELLKYHKRVLYIDIDIHHGDGVEEAFYTTDRVLTVSFHKFGEYFPGTGDIRDIGSGPGKYHAINFPLKDGIDDESYHNIFRPIIQSIMEIYAPGAVVMQCGADSLSGDRLGCFNLSSKGHGQCVEFVASFGLPLLILGGGGYTIRNVARCWCYETALLVGEELPDELPYNDYIEYYGPDFRLYIPPTNMENQNTKDQLEKYKMKILENIRRIGRPNAASHEIPPDSYPDSDEEELDQEDEDMNPDTRLTERQMDKRIANNDEFSDSDDDDDRRDRDHDIEDRMNGSTTAANQEQSMQSKSENIVDSGYGIKKNTDNMEVEQDEEAINNDNEDDDNYEDDNNTNRHDATNENELASDNEDEEKDRPNRNY